MNSSIFNNQSSQKKPIVDNGNTKKDVKEHVVVKRLLRHQAQEVNTQRHYKSFEYQVMEAESFSALLSLLLDASKAHFNLASVSVFIVDTKYSLYDLFEQLSIGNYQNRLQVRHNFGITQISSRVFTESNKKYF